MHHACGGLADISVVHHVHGPWWTDYIPKGYDLIPAVHVNPMAVSERDDHHRLHSASGKPAMAVGELCTTTNAGAVL